MKQTAIMVLMVVFFAAQAMAGEGTVLKGQMEKESYATGITLVRNLIQQGGSFDLDLVIKGMKDAITGEKLLLTDEDLQITLAALRNELKKHQANGVIESPDQYKAIEREDIPITAASPSPQEPAQVQTPVRDEEQALRALSVASIAPPKGSAQQTSALSPSSLPTPAQSGPPVQEHTFASLAAQQQQQTNDEGTVQIVLSDLTRRHAELWLKTQPHQQ